MRFCSNSCAIQAQNKAKQDAWLEGKHNGMRGKTSTAVWVKAWVIAQRGEQCWECGWSKRNPHSKTIPVELSHKDGDYTNNRPQNLELLCPSCHSLTKTWKGGGKKGRPRAKYYRGV